LYFQERKEKRRRGKKDNGKTEKWISGQMDIEKT